MYKLTLTEEQAQLVSTACEFYARMRMGQFNELLWHTLDKEPFNDDFLARKNDAEQLLLEARQKIYPDLQGPGHSYGVGKFEDADKAYDVHQVIRHAMGDDRAPYSNYELPRIEKE